MLRDRGELIVTKLFDSTNKYYLDVFINLEKMLLTGNHILERYQLVNSNLDCEILIFI